MILQGVSLSILILPAGECPVAKLPLNLVVSNQLFKSDTRNLFRQDYLFGKRYKGK